MEISAEKKKKKNGKCQQPNFFLRDKIFSRSDNAVQVK
jgi:hypothetical protein